MTKKEELYAKKMDAIERIVRNIRADCKNSRITVEQNREYFSDGFDVDMIDSFKWTMEACEAILKIIGVNVDGTSSTKTGQ